MTFLVDTKICPLWGSMRHPQPLLSRCLQEEDQALAANNRGASLQHSAGCRCRRCCCRWVCYGPFSSSRTRERRKDNSDELQSSCEDTTYLLPGVFPYYCLLACFSPPLWSVSCHGSLCSKEDLTSSSSDSLTSAGASKPSIYSPRLVSVSSDSLRAPKVHVHSALL